MNEETLGFIIIAISFSIIGGFIGYVVYRIKNRKNKEMQKILKNPKLLVQELKKHGKIYDVGKDDVKEELEIMVETDSESGEEKVVINRKPVEKKLPPQEDKPRLKKRHVRPRSSHLRKTSRPANKVRSKALGG